MRPGNRLKTLLALFASFATTPSAAMTVIHTEKSLYRNIIVYEEDDQRCMSFSRRDQTARQTCQSLNDPDQFVFTYTRMMMGALYLNPHPRKILIIGLGGGVLPTALVKMFPDTRIDVVEIDPAVVKVARQFFGFNPDQRIQVFEEDGRVFVKRAGKSGRQYDLIMLDAFDHDYIPEHLLTQEFLFEVKALLAADGVLGGKHLFDQPPVPPRIDHLSGGVWPVLQPPGQDEESHRADQAGRTCRRSMRSRRTPPPWRRS
ncbi:MAG: fused MFS/spermidine synthase [Candidatus Competibacter sp.]